MLDLIETKILVGCLFCIVRFLCGILPLKLYKYLKLKDGEETSSDTFVNEKRHRQVTNGLAMFQAFGGGVIFATCFLHMMPEVYESTIELKKFGLIESHYPFSQLIVSIGFFLVYFIEELAHYMISRMSDEDSDKKQHRIESARTVTPSNKVAPEIATIIDEYPTPTKERNEEVERENEINLKKAEEFLQSEENGLGFETNKDLQTVEELDKLIDTKCKTQQQILRGVLLVLALSLHAFFEGLAIGMQLSIRNIWYLFIAVSIHSATILFCISMELLMANARCKIIIVHVLILSLTSPIGVFLGLLITLRADMNSKAKSLAVVFLEGLSAGTITYITFFEVLLREKGRRMCRMKRAILIIVGFGLMACLECGEMYY